MYKTEDTYNYFKLHIACSMLVKVIRIDRFIHLFTGNKETSTVKKLTFNLLNYFFSANSKNIFNNIQLNIKYNKLSC